MFRKRKLTVARRLSKNSRRPILSIFFATLLISWSAKAGIVDFVQNQFKDTLLYDHYTKLIGEHEDCEDVGFYFSQQRLEGFAQDDERFFDRMRSLTPQPPQGEWAQCAGNPGWDAGYRGGLTGDQYVFVNSNYSDPEKLAGAQYRKQLESDASMSTQSREAANNCYLAGFYQGMNELMQQAETDTDGALCKAEGLLGRSDAKKSCEQGEGQCIQRDPDKQQLVHLGCYAGGYLRGTEEYCGAREGVAEFIARYETRTSDSVDKSVPRESGDYGTVTNDPSGSQGAQ